MPAPWGKYRLFGRHLGSTARHGQSHYFCGAAHDESSYLEISYINKCEGVAFKRPAAGLLPDGTELAQTDIPT